MRQVPREAATTQRGGKYQWRLQVYQKRLQAPRDAASAKRGGKYPEGRQVPMEAASIPKETASTKRGGKCKERRQVPRVAESTKSGGKYQERRKVPRDAALPRESASFKRCGRPYQERPQYSNKLHGQMHHARPGFLFIKFINIRRSKITFLIFTLYPCPSRYFLSFKIDIYQTFSSLYSTCIQKDAGMTRR